jgi:hypothetical protein
MSYGLMRQKGCGKVAMIVQSRSYEYQYCALDLLCTMDLKHPRKGVQAELPRHARMLKHSV